MKVRIKSGDCPSYLTRGRFYEAHKTDNPLKYFIEDDDGDDLICNLFDCVFLNGGSWEIVDE